MAHPKLWVHEVGGCDEYYRAARVEDVAGWLETHFTTLQVPAPQWRPVSEPPHDGDEVLCHRVADGHLGPWSSVLTYLDGGRWVRREGNHERLLAPTHWMPLPDPPEVTP